MAGYANAPMKRITDDEYNTLLSHLSEQIAALMPDGLEHQAHQSAVDALTNAWQDYKTANEWLADAGKRLGLDTSGCVGA